MAHDQKVVGSNPGTVFWMDVSDDASYYIKENKSRQILSRNNLMPLFATLHHSLPLFTQGWSWYTGLTVF
jgi:hypothetical protein